MRTSKSRKIQEMDSEYRFDYERAKPNRFAEKMNLNVGWTVEKFVEKVKKTSSANGKNVNGKKPAQAKASPNGRGKTPSPKGKSATKKSSPKKKAKNTKNK